MDRADQDPEHLDLEEAQEMIRRQQAEIQRLQEQLADFRLVEDLRSAFNLAATASVLGTRVSHVRLLEMIVETAARVIGARAASLFLIDHDASELVFEVATGPKAEEVKQFRVPLGRGIAGLVAATGQPLAISNVEDDPRHASHIAESVGYMPQSILCVPLFFEGQIIGVFELLDRESGESFGPADIELLGHFASQAAIAIEQSRVFRGLVPLVGQALEELGLIPDELREPLRERANAFAESVESSASHQQAMELARLVQEVSSYGDGECELCRQILTSFASHLRSRSGGSRFGARL